MPNVFITGFERSGTTLLRRLISMWPGFDKDLIHEGRKLMSYGTRQEAENNYFDEYTHIKCGEKVPYYNNARWVMDYIYKFHQFWPEGIILHIVRYPDAVAESCLRTFKRPVKTTALAYAENVLTMNQYLNEESNAFAISYEKMIEQPKECLKILYEILGNVPDDKIIDKILTTKEPWKLGKKRMCGLRYFNKVGKTKH